MWVLSRHIFREVATSAFLGTVLFTFVLFLQKLGRLFEQLVTSSATLEQVGSLFLLILPQTFPFSIPVGILTGVLIAMGRMSSDGEIVALRAAGVPSRRVTAPVLTFAAMGLAVAAYATCILTPWATRETFRIVNDMGAAQVTAEIQPRVFEEQFPNRVLYVEDVIPGPVVKWRNVFMADLRPPDQRDGAGDRGEAPRITLAAEAIAVPDLVNNRIQLSLRNGSNFETARKVEEYYAQAFPKGEQVLDAPRRSEKKAKDYTELEMGPLWEQAREHVPARIEFHQRLALPVACVVLALVAVPLGISSRKGGKSAAFVMTVALGFLYYMAQISLVALARQGTLPVGVAVWIPNIVFAALAAILMARLERPGDGDWAASIKAAGAGVWHWLGGATGIGKEKDLGRFRFPLLPQLLDTYVLTTFLYYFVVLLLSFVLMTHVFTFFELLGDILKNKIPMALIGRYHLFLTPRLIFDSAPMSVLVAVLITFGLLAKSNELTAMKACGVSLYRLAIPVLLAGLILSGALFAFDYYVVPEANLVQDAIRNQIKGRPVQTFLRPDRKWIFGKGPWIYYYKHFDAEANVMVGVSIYELDRKMFRLNRHIYAENARWEPGIKHWVFQNGWMREFNGFHVTKFADFRETTATFPELDEPPGYFLKEVKQDKQMNFHQLAGYIEELKQSGFDTVRLQVQYQKKFSVPLFAVIMALISTPFAFFTGNRGAMAPVGISLGIAICYYALGSLFEQMGHVGQLPAQLAAWSPDAIFSLAGTYLLMRVRS